jgi:hypothetical protein
MTPCQRIFPERSLLIQALPIVPRSHPSESTIVTCNVRDHNKLIQQNGRNEKSTTVLLLTMPAMEPFWDMAPSTMRARMVMDALRFMADCGEID